MRQKLILFTALLFAILTATGCPNPVFRFTSADPNGNRIFLDGAEDAAGGDEPDGGGQEREVVEPDVYRVQGDTLYILNQYRGLLIVDLATLEILARVPTQGFPRDLFFKDGNAYALVSQATEFETAGNEISFDTRSMLYVIDVTDPAEAGVIGSFALEGDLVDSRLVGDALYAVCAEYDYYWYPEASTAKRAKASASWVVSLHIADPADVYEADALSFAGLGDVVHVTQEAIFVAGRSEGGATAITYVDISDPGGLMSLRGAASVRGRVADRYKMDVHDGVLRVVSAAREAERQVYVTTIDLADPDALAVLAELRLEGAEGEQLFATRFDGDLAYVVTFFVIDPLFVVDLSDPANPVKTGELEIPGWSTHIEPMGDRLIALGVDDTDGGRKVSVSLFDVSNSAAPVLLDRVRFGEEWTWSTAYGDVKAFSVGDDLIAVPVSGWTETTRGYDHLQFISWEADGLTTRGALSLQGSIQRSFPQGEAYYGLTTEQLAAFDLTDLDAPELTDTVVLAENIADFVEVTPDYGLTLIHEYDTGLTRFQAVSLPDRVPAGEVSVKAGSPTSLHVVGDTAYAVSTSWREKPAYHVVELDVSNPAAPVLGETLQLDVEPYADYYCCWLDGFAEIGIWPPRRGPAGDSAFVVDGLLALRCRAERYDAVLGPDRPRQGLALVELETMEWTRTVGFGYDRIQSLDHAGGALYLGTAAEATTPASRPLVAHMLREIQLDPLGAGPAANVPGGFVQYDPAADLLVTRDLQWRAVMDKAESSLCTLRWDGETEAELLERLGLPGESATVLGRGAKVYLSAYEGNRLTLAAVAVGDDGSLMLGDPVVVSESWASLLDAKGNNAYVSVGGGAIGHYVFDPAGRLADLLPIMGHPEGIRFGRNAAYAPLGYYGLATLPVE